MKMHLRQRKSRYLNGLTMVALAILFVGIGLFGTIGTAQAQGQTVDVDGPDDWTNPNESDLSQMGFVQNGTTIDVGWSFDDTSFSNLALGCALIDSDGDGNVNFSLCQGVNGSPAASAGFILYNCSNKKVDTCSIGGGTSGEITPLTGTTCAISVVADPFDGVAAYMTPFTLHNAAGTSIAPDPVNDIGVTCTLDSADLPADEISAPLTLTNVCSYTSATQNSDAKDCVVAQGSGFINIVKVADPDDSTQFNFTLNPAAKDGSTLFSINGSGSTRVAVDPANLYALSESVPVDWNLNTAVCTNNSGGTGTLDTTLPASGVVNAGLTGIQVVAAQDTVCTFTNDSTNLAVTIGYFLAEQDGDVVNFTWQTATETGVAGFNLFAETDGGLVQVNDALIPSTIIDSVVPTDYSYEAATSATVFYIEEVNINGSADRIGPFVLGTPSGAHSGVDAQFTPVIWLPMINF